MTRRLSLTAVVALLALAALAGALLSSLAAGDDATPAAPAPTPAAVAAPSHLERTLPATAHALAAARRAGRERLAAARDSRAQAAAAAHLAVAYHRAAVRLAGAAEAAGVTVLLGALDRAEHAYELLADAARAGDRPGYRVARTEVADAERLVPAALTDALAQVD